jgi:MFS family permease
VAAFYGYLAASLGANNLEVSVVAIAGLLTGALTGVPLGRAIDRIGEIRAIWYGTVLTLASYGIFMFSITWSETIPAQAVRNGGLSFLGPGMTAWVARNAPPGQRAEYLGVFSLINSSLWSVGPLIGAVAIELYGYFGLFVMAIGTTVLSLVVMEFLYGEMGLRARLQRQPSDLSPA